ncbi:MAG: HemK2/MTQ2 family protein methyltransferase [Nanoarchaeota archaeon]
MIYQIAEDSYLLLKIIQERIPNLLNKNPNLKFLEIGSGSGIQLETALKSGIKKENIFSCDINTEAVKHCKKVGFNCIKSNLFEKIKGKFDLIVFNPPYLPEEKKEPRDSKLSTTGGKKGSELINEFLRQAKKYLNKDGRIFLLTSNLTKGINFNNYKKKKIEGENLFFEKIFVWELRN